MMTTLVSSHWAWTSWWKRLLRKRTYYHMVGLNDAETHYWKFEEWGKRWSQVGPGEYKDTLEEVSYD